MEALNAKTIGVAKKRTLHGREYLVAPMTLIVPGVLNGSQGALYYPPEEVSKHPEIWNHKPITLNHPPKGANDPDILNQTQLGFLLNARFEGGKLVADGWFDVFRVAQVDKRILANLSDGKPIELSTGLAVDMDPVQNGDFQGKPYSAIARNYRPDHLAILPDAVGACSLKDGCGVLVNELKEVILKLFPEDVRELVATLNQTLGDKPMATKKLVDDLIANCSCWTESDRETLNAMPDAKVQTLVDAAKKSKETEAVANAAKAGYEGEAGQFVWNGDSKKMEFLAKMKKGKGGGKAEDDDEEEEEEPKKPAKNQAKQLSAEEWFKQAPPEVQSAVKNAMDIEIREKQQLIDRITANVEDADKKAKVANRLKDKSLDELRDLAELAPQVNNQNPFSPGYRPDYSGQAAGVANSDPLANSRPEPLGLPSWHDYADAK